jgi:hypothetical protein
MLYGPDVSNYQSQFNRVHADALAAAGVTFAIIGRQYNNRPYAHAQRQAFADAGIAHIAEYLISLRGEWPQLFDGTRFVAIDVEPGGEFTDEDSIDAAVDFVRVQGREPLIYSSNWAWNALGLANVTKYADAGIRLWNAHYDLNPGNFDLAYPFGGWTRCAIDQFTDRWQGSQAIPFPLDMNAAEDGLFSAPEPPPDPDPEPPQGPVPVIPIRAHAAEIVRLLEGH